MRTLDLTSTILNHWLCVCGRLGLRCVVWLTYPCGLSPGLRCGFDCAAYVGTMERDEIGALTGVRAP